MAYLVVYIYTAYIYAAHNRIISFSVFLSLFILLIYFHGGSLSSI